MSFDGSDSTPALNRARLVAALRDLPPNHRWDFTYCWDDDDCGTSGCACGVATIIGLSNSDDLNDVFPLIGLTENQADNILSAEIGFTLDFYGVLPHQVTAAMVADALEAVG